MKRQFFFFLFVKSSHSRGANGNKSEREKLRGVKQQPTFKLWSSTHTLADTYCVCVCEVRRECVCVCVKESERDESVTAG